MARTAREIWDAGFPNYVVPVYVARFYPTSPGFVGYFRIGWDKEYETKSVVGFLNNWN